MSDNYIDELISSVETEIQIEEETYREYYGSIAHLKDGRSGKILGGEGLKLSLQDSDGKDFECYHNDLEYIFTP